MNLSPIAVVISMASLATLVAAAVVDVRDRIIPNRLVVLVLGGGLGVRLLSEPLLIWLSLIACLAVYTPLAYAAHHDVLGGGDAKMITAVTLLVPPYRVPSLLLDIALAGGIVACLYLAARFSVSRHQPSPAYASMRGGRGAGFGGFIRTEVARIANGEPMPYGVAIVGGVAYYLLWDAVR